MNKTINYCFEPKAARQLILLIGISMAYAMLNIIFSSLSLISFEASDSKTLPSIIGGFFSSSKFLADIVIFFLNYLGAHAFIAILWFILWNPIKNKLNLEFKSQKSFIVLSFLPVLLWISAFNGQVYPESIFAISKGNDSIYLVNVFLLFITTAYIFSVTFISSFLFLKSKHSLLKNLICQTKKWRKAYPIAASIFLMTLISLNALSKQNESKKILVPEKPNIIIIGVDSLRTDHVGFLNNQDKNSITPNIDKLLNGAAIIEDTWTPLARTFPAWMSILTGQYPATHGGFYNLMARDRVDDSGSLPNQLGKMGYERIFAIDETRFANIDKSYGFDQIVSPKIGAIDFLLGGFADLPLVNLISNTWLGSFLFPNIYMNRAFPLIYKPEIFDRELELAIASSQHEKPLFLAVHFELPHYPYTWFDSKNSDFDLPIQLAGISSEIYQSAVKRADNQVAALVQSLKITGRLDNAILILVSDHGESFKESEPVWDSVGKNQAQILSTGWHGTNVFSESQYRVMLGFRGYGAQKKLVRSGLHKGITASLVDIRPTLHQWINLDADSGIEGISLFPVIRGDSYPVFLQNRVVSLESGFSLPSLLEKDIENFKIAAEGAAYYSIDRNGRLAIKESLIPMLLTSKQYAAISGEWILGALPSSKSDKHFNLLLANLKNHRHWNVCDKSSLPSEAPFSDLLNKIYAQMSRIDIDAISLLTECNQR